jgi:hypothetical protein
MAKFLKAVIPPVVETGKPEPDPEQEDKVRPSHHQPDEAPGEAVDDSELMPVAMPEGTVMPMGPE